MTEPSINLLSFLSFFICMVIGAYWHYKKVSKTGRHEGTLFDYLLADNPRGTTKVGFAILLSSWTAATSGTADYINLELLFNLLINMQLHIPSINIVILAIGLGYTFDSQLNKGGNEKR